MYVWLSPLHAESVVTLTGDPWPPYVIGELGGEATGGSCIELVQKLFARLDDVGVSFPLIPWERALREVREGSKDGIVLLLKTPEREEYMEYTDPLFTSYNLVWYSKRRFPAGFEWKRLEDFSPYSLGIVRGYSYGDEVDQALQKGELKATEVNTVDQLFTMLAGDRIDLALANDGVGFALARQHSKAEVVAANMATGEDVLYVAFSRRSEARRLIPQINEILAELRDQGVVERTIRGGH